MDTGVRATVVTAGYCTHAELTRGHALATCYSKCQHQRVCKVSLRSAVY